jgi:putative membrane protein
MDVMIDYVTLLLVNMMAGLLVLAFFLWWGITQKDRRDWAPAFGITGLIGTVVGLAMTFTWPIPAPYAMAYGEMSTLLGVLFLGAAWALHCGWRLYPLGIYAFFPGVAAIVLGIRIIHLSLTAAPVLAGISFIVTGLGGVCAGLTLWKQDVMLLRLVGGFVMLAAAGLWAPTTYLAYWMHMEVKPASSAAADDSQPTSETQGGTQGAEDKSPASASEPG